MNKRTTVVAVVFASLLTVTLGGIILHQLSGYDYPTSPAFSYEMNVIGDLYEAFIMVPLGLVGLWAMLRKGSAWGPLIIGGVAGTFAYNYAMVSAGRQNLWIFLWVLKVALGGTTVALVWDLLPAGAGTKLKPRIAAAVYFLVVIVAFGKMMGQRLLASAHGYVMEMTMQAGGAAVDWAEPNLRDPVVFFAMACPMILAAVTGLWRGTAAGARAGALTSTFLINMVLMILATGPVRELLQHGSVSAGMVPMSVIFIVAAAPAAWLLLSLAKENPRVGQSRAAA